MLEIPPALLRRLVEDHPEPVWTHDADTLALLEANGAALRLTGYPREEWRHLRLGDLLPGEDVARLGAALASGPAGWVRQPGCRLRPRAGEPVRLDLLAYPGEADGRRVVLVVGQRPDPQDVVAALRRQEEQYRFVVENVRQVIFQTDARGVLTFLNPAWCELTGYEVAASLGTSLLRYVHPADRQAHAELFQLAGRGGEPAARELRYLTRAGGVRWVEVYADLATSPEGRVTGLFGTLADVTERKEAEAALRESEQRYRILAEHISDVVWTTTPDLTLTYVSPSLRRLTGYGAGEVLGRSLGDLLAPPSRAALERVATEAAGWPGPPADPDGATVELEVMRRDGSTVWTETRISCLRGADGRLRGLLGATRDITERRAAEAALRQSQEQFHQAQKMEAVGRLAGGIAHDFNNLLTVIHGRAELLLARGLVPGAARRDLELVRQTAERASALVRQLLTFSRKQVLQPRVVDLNALVAGAETVLRRIIGEDVLLVTALGATRACVRADPARLEQVILNLAVNARDAMPRGGRLTLETANVELGSADASTRPGLGPGLHVVLRVRDTGVGMDEATRARIFEPFFTTKGPGQGTGLGLSTVYGIVTQSGGHIEVESAPGRGSTFTIFLPTVAGPPDPAEAAPVPFRLGPGRETVLLVEDDDGVRSVVRETLEAQGYRLLEARHPGEALLLGERCPEPVHLLVTDVVMPQMSGRELAERVRAVRPELRVLFISGYDADPAGDPWPPGSRFLAKPFTPAALLGTVRALLDDGPPAATEEAPRQGGGAAQTAGRQGRAR